MGSGTSSAGPSMRLVITIVRYAEAKVAVTLLSAMRYGITTRIRAFRHS